MITSTSASVASPSVPSVSYARIFEGISVRSQIWLVVGLMCIAGTQVSSTLHTLFMAWVFEQLMGDESDPAEVYHKVCMLIIYWAVLATVMGAFAFFSTYAFLSVGQEVGYLYRLRYLHALLNKEVSYFDKHKTSEFPETMARECRQIEDGAGYQLMLLCRVIFSTLSNFLIPFCLSPQFTIVCTCFSLLAALINMLCTLVYTWKTRAKATAYTKVSGIAEESLTELNTVAAYTAEDYFSTRYDNELKNPLSEEQKAGVLRGMGLGIATSMWLLVAAVVPLLACVWLNHNVENWIWGDHFSKSDAFIIFYLTVYQANLFGNFSRAFQICVESRDACSRAVAFIEEPVQFRNGAVSVEIKGKVQFKDIRFAYPTLPDKTVLNGVNFTSETGQRTAIVGESGEGKSTLLQLLERFYEPTSGAVLIDDIPVTDLDIDCVRRQIGYVSQEPILFNLTIRENILLGWPSASEDEVREAAQSAMALEFILELEDGLDTNVGIKGSSLSAGQKQRIAVARALIRKPKILILDEATSALDSGNEQVILESLNTIYAVHRMTIISVAQKLSTVQNYDKIAVLQKGVVAEQGPHTALSGANGPYSLLWKGQQHEICESKSESLGPKTLDSSMKAKSRSTQLDDGDDDAPLTEKSKVSPFFRLCWALRRYWPLVTICILASVGAGMTYPLMAYYVSRMAFDTYTYAGEDLKSHIHSTAIEVVIFACVAFFCFFILEFTFTVIVARANKRLRSTTYRHMLHLDAAYFDGETHTHGVLTKRLSSDVDVVGNAGVPFISTIVLITVSFTAAVGMSFYWDWRMGLLVLFLLPIQAYLVASCLTVPKEFTRRANNPEVNALILDSTRNIKTVTAYHMQTPIQDRTSAYLLSDIAKARRTKITNGLRVGVGVGIVSWAFCLTFWFGNYLIHTDSDANVEDICKAIYACAFTAQGISILVLFAPSFFEGITAAKRIYSLLDYQPTINTSNEAGLKEPIKGHVAFNQVSFLYPARNKLVLRNINFEITPGQYVGLAGASGSGKSTIIQLILRFYDATEGVVTIDGVDVRLYNIKHLRQSVALVSQEPVMFSGSVRSNVDFGLGKSDEEIKEALIKAALPRFSEDLDREVGVRGGQFSGGQKQRLALARALLRSPAILILDEATSALDSLTEKKVSQAIQVAAENRTVITIAHRASTFEKCEKILVLGQGAVVEQGSHSSLISQPDSMYSRLLSSQNKS